MRIGGVDVVATAKSLFHDFQEDDLTGLAAEVAYNLLFSVVPLLIFLTALSGFIGRWIGTDEVVSGITSWLGNESNLPVATREVVITPIEQVLSSGGGGFLSFGALLALWSGKNAVGSLMKALNVAFDVKETRPWWKTNLIAVGLTIALGVALVASSLFFLAGSEWGNALATRLDVSNAWTTGWGLLRWPLILVLLTVGLAFFYWAAPNVQTPVKWLMPGSLLAVVLWAMATLGLGSYFQYFGGYVTTYGVLGGVLAFVFWLYLMSLIVLLGGELNSVLARQHDPKTRAEMEHPPKGLQPIAGAPAATRAEAAGKRDAVSTFHVERPRPTEITAGPNRRPGWGARGLVLALALAWRAGTAFRRRSR